MYTDWTNINVYLWFGNYLGPYILPPKGEARVTRNEK